MNRSNGDGGNYYAQIPEAVLYGPVSALAVRVYGCLDRHADDRGRCWPSLEKISELCDCSVSSVQRAMRELVAVGAFSIRRRAGQSNVYVLRWRQGLQVGHEPWSPRTPVTHDRGNPGHP